MLIRRATSINRSEVDIRIVNGFITDVRAHGDFDESLWTSDTVIDAEGLLVMPGVIDPHVHLNFPLQDDPDELIRSETRAALAGGVTTVGHMPLGVQGSLLDDFATLSKRINKHSSVAIEVIYPIINADQLDEIEPLIEGGLKTFKFFRAYKPPDVYGFSGADDTLLLKVMERIAALSRRYEGVRLAVHCENTELFAVYRERHMLANPDLGRGSALTSPTWQDARPSVVEAESVASLLSLAEFTKCPIRIVHVSAKESLDYVRFFRTRGVDVIVETTPMYLETHSLITGTVSGPAWTRVQPSVKGPDDAAALYHGIRSGTVDVIGTDHCANFADVYDGAAVWDQGLGGRSIVELSLPLLLNAAAKGRVTLEDVQRVMCEGGANALGLSDRGWLSPGKRADVVLCDLDLQRTVLPDALVSRSDYTAFEGRRLTGWPVLTIQHGSVAFVDGDYETRVG
jgi:dihydroorotase-like cyclic amidohydrolase